MPVSTIDQVEVLEGLLESPSRMAAPLVLGPEGEILHGQLDNGLTYYIRSCSKPKDRVAIALAVKIGSVVEEEGERGVAHILEHLAFNATERYSNHEIVRFLEKIGAEFGACQNAYTSSDETVYQLVVPSDEPELLGDALDVLAEWAFGIRCAAQDLEKERGAVMEEWRMNRDASGRAAEAHWKLVMGEGSRYAERLPIGLEKIIRGVKAETVKGFFTRWYRPELMAVVIVGDFNHHHQDEKGEAEENGGIAEEEAAHTATAAAEAASPASIPSSSSVSSSSAIIRDLLLASRLNKGPSDMALTPPPPPRPWFSFIPHFEPRCRVMVDREVQESSVYISFKSPRKDMQTPAQYLDYMVDMAFESAFSSRLFKLSRGTDPPFASASVSAQEPLTTTVNTSTLSATAIIEEEEAGLGGLSWITKGMTGRKKGYSSSSLKRLASSGSSTSPRKRTAAAAAGSTAGGAGGEEDSVGKEEGPPEEEGEEGPREGEGPALRALRQLLLEVARIRVHGFHPKEISRALRELVADIENTFLERDQSYCWDLRDEYLRHFLNKEFVTGQAYEARLSKTLLPLLTKELIEARAAIYHPSNSCVIKVVEHSRTCSDHNVRKVVDFVCQLEERGLIKPWTLDDLTPVPEYLIPPDQLPQPGEILSEKQWEEENKGGGGVLGPGVTEVVLANGMRVCFKPTSFMEDEVLLTGFATGGLSEVPPDLFLSASMTTSIAGQLGACGFKPSLLSDLLAGKRVQLDLAEGAFSRTLKGVQSPADLEETFQLVHLLFKTEVQVEEAELKVVMRLVKQGLEAQIRNPGYEYANRCKMINYGDCYYWRPMKVEDMDKIDPHISCAFHNSNYRNPAEFTLVFTGNVTREVLMPLILKYLASIPSTSLPPPLPPSNVTPLPVVFPETPVVEDVIVDMVNSITQTQLTFPVRLDKAEAREQLIWLALACRLLETRLLQRLRFEFGEIYMVSVSSYFGCEAPSNKGDLHGDVAISFSCDPVNRKRLVEMTLETVEALQSSPSSTSSSSQGGGLGGGGGGGGPSASSSSPLRAEEIETVVNLERLQFENSQQENRYWHGVLVSAYQSKTYQAVQDIQVVYEKNLAARTHVLAAVTPERMSEMMRRMLPYPCRRRYTAVSMVPRPPPLMTRVLGALVNLVTFPLQRWAGGGGGGGGRGRPLGEGVEEEGEDDDEDAASVASLLAEMEGEEVGQLISPRRGANPSPAGGIVNLKPRLPFPACRGGGGGQGATALSSACSICSESGSASCRHHQRRLHTEEEEAGHGGPGAYLWSLSSPSHSASALALLVLGVGGAAALMWYRRR